MSDQTLPHATNTMTTLPPRIIIKGMDYSFGEILTVAIPLGDPDLTKIVIYDALEQPLRNVTDIKIYFRLTEGISELSFTHYGKARQATIIDFANK